MPPLCTNCRSNFAEIDPYWEGLCAPCFANRSRMHGPVCSDEEWYAGEEALWRERHDHRPYHGPEQS